jgi:hypothetical protein
MRVMGITPAVIENPGCVAYDSATGGWELVEVSRAAVGLPATIAPPLSIVGN